MHKKDEHTYFKAAIEYQMGPQISHRTMHDENKDIQRQINDGRAKLVRDA